ncbi:MAG: hypothetical protein K9I37_10375 [Crocinitomicaceae bacterium]|nr:hypothetical protein [Crocinitomicaceae bacterium]
MRYYLFIISIVISQILTAQSGNTFTISLSSGVGMTKNTTIAENKPLDNLSNIHTALNFGYGIKLPKNLSCDLNFSIENMSYFPYPKNLGGWNTGSNLGSELGAGLRYKIPIKNNALSIGLNGGVRLTGFSNYSYQISSEFSYSNTYYLFKKVNPFMKLQLSYEFPLKNKDLLGIDLSYRQSFHPIYSMGHQYSGDFPFFFVGTYTYSGNSMHIGLHYTWTKNKKNAEIASFMLDSVDRKAAKKIMATKNRFQSSKAILIQLHQGGFMNQSKIMNNPDKVFKNFSGPSSSIRLNATVGWKNNWSFQPGISLDSYWLWLHDQKYGTGYSGTNLFNLFTVDLGMKRRMLSFPKSNRYLCNLNGGISFSYLNGSGGGSGSSTSFDPNTGQVILSYNYSYQYNNKIFPLAYVGVSKDLRLSKHFLFTIAYRHQFGLSRGMVIPFDYTAANQSPVYTKIRVNGNANCLSVGLTYRFNNKRIIVIDL